MHVEIYTKLVEECNRQTKALNEEGSTVNLVEYKYLSNCLDCMEYMDKFYNIDLDCSNISLEVIDIMFENAHEAYLENEFDNLDLFIDMFSGYVGMVYKNAFGGNFVYDEIGEALNINTNHIYVNNEVRNCIVNGTKISDYFNHVKEVI